NPSRRRLGAQHTLRREFRAERDDRGATRKRPARPGVRSLRRRGDAGTAAAIPGTPTYHSQGNGVKSDWRKWLFTIAAIYDGLFGLIFFFFWRDVYLDSNVMRSTHEGYVTVPSLLLMLFGA